MMKNIVIQNPEKLEKIKKSIVQAGAENLHVLSDFDRTLTRASVDGEKRPSLISVLRDGDYLTPDYAEKAHALYNKYGSIEANPDISMPEKKKAMRQWWQSHFDLLIKSGLNKDDLKKVVVSEKVKLRHGALEFFDLLRTNEIPLIILSATGLGNDMISIYLEKESGRYDNVYIVSNSFEWDERGYMVGVKEPIIHSMNKDETIVKDFPAAFGAIKNRTNVLLLGDNLGDVGMAEGFDYEHLIKIGFLNDKIDQNLEQYKNSYDIVILDDSSMDYVNDLLKEIIERQ